MTRSIWAVAVLAVAAAFPGTWAAAGEALTNADIVRLTKAGVGDGAIVAMIETSATDFDTGVDEVVGLTEAGVGESVIAAMARAGVSAGVAPASDRSGHSTGTPAPKSTPGSRFRDTLGSGGEGPEMVVIPAGRFRMGCLSNDDDCDDTEKPVREVAIAVPFALSVHEVTFEDYDRFTYPNEVDDEGWGRGTRPVMNVSWDDARDYVEWLSSQTGAEYRLPSEAEWEYAARAGTTTKYSWGDEIGTNRANCHGCGGQWDGSSRTAPVGSFRPNGFGVHDMHGNVREWVEDCWNGSYAGAPSDGGARLGENCGVRVLRGGSWNDLPRILRGAYRDWIPTGFRYYYIGFRVARTLAP